MHIDDFDFPLPPERVALFPAPERDHSRLFVLDRGSDEYRHCRFADLPRFLRPEDVLVLNETRVLAARLRGEKSATGGRVELLLVRPHPEGGWLAMGKPMKGMRVGVELVFASGSLRGRVVARESGERLRVEFCAGDGHPVEDPTVAGQVPLPPYIQREVEPEDATRYQTVYAAHGGSVAAPTAGLHFTEALLRDIEAAGVAVVRLTLHVGPGTFAPVRTADPRNHQLESEFYELPAHAAEEIGRRRRQGGRVLAVGTTVVRTLETCAGADGGLQPGSGWTEMFIYPPYAFRAVDAMVTNFHLPRSSLLMLVAALAGREQILAAYGAAVAEGYRFYSYGDAMLIL
ncbi:tRNA preQ1(34) S-adenosylmethionine ribosyltransferase-isomerase QueA [Candidatus Latescibacterota bacterium]